MPNCNTMKAIPCEPGYDASPVSFSDRLNSETDAGVWTDGWIIRQSGCLLFTINILSLSCSFESNWVQMSTDSFPHSIFQLHGADDGIDDFVWNWRSLRLMPL